VLLVYHAGYFAGVQSDLGCVDHNHIFAVKKFRTVLFMRKEEKRNSNLNLNKQEIHLLHIHTTAVSKSPKLITQQTMQSRVINDHPRDNHKLPANTSALCHTKNLDKRRFWRFFWSSIKLRTLDHYIIETCQFLLL